MQSIFYKVRFLGMCASCLSNLKPDTETGYANLNKCCRLDKFNFFEPTTEVSCC